MPRLRLTLTVFALLGMAVSAGRPDALAQPNSYPFKRISVEEGLSQSTVNAIVQDRQGFLWFGTQDGLNRYDGYRFTVLQHDAQDPASLSSNWVSALYVDRAGTLWVGTHGGGLNRYDAQTGRFTRYRHDPGDANTLAHDIVSSILEDRSGHLWVGTFGGVSRLDPTTGRFTTYQHDPGDPQTLGSDRALVLAEDAQGTLWVGTDQGGLARLADADAGRFTTFRHHPDDPTSLSHNIILALHPDPDGSLWIGTAAGGLNRLDPATGRFTAYQHDPGDPNTLSHNRVLSIHHDGDGALWVGTDGGGLNRLAPLPSAAQREEGPPPAPGAERFTRYQHAAADLHSLSSDVVTSIYADQAGILWVGTGGAGLNRKSRFVHYQPLPEVPHTLNNPHVLALHTDGDDVLWVGTDGGGLNRLDPATGRFTAYRHDPAQPNSLSHNRVLGIAADRQGRLWVATGGGLDRMDAAAGRFTHYRHDPDDPNSLSNNRVFFAYEAPRWPGTIWAGTWGGGLNRLDVATGRFTHYRHNPGDPNSLSNNRVIAIQQDRDGHLWVGTFGGGLNRLDPETGAVTTYRHDPDDPTSLSQDIVATIYEDTAGRLWIGTGEGLNRLDRATGAFHRYTQRDGLPNNTIYGILEDADGVLWLSTNKGLSAFNPEADASTGPATGFINYDVGDGLQSNEFSQGAYHRSRSGELFFGGINGVTRFHPTALHAPEPPPVVLTALGVGTAAAQTLPPAPLPTITLEREHAFAVEFAALDFANPARNRYAYRLDGYDTDWQYRDADRRFVAYANVPGGSYTFRVRGANSDGQWNEDGLALAVTVVPPFWETGWFRLLAVLTVTGLLGGLAFAWHRVRIRQVERLRDERTEIQRRLTESREAERLFLAQELHDGAVQDLYGVQFQMGLFTEGLPAEEDRQTLAQGQQAVQGVIEQLRTICGELRPPVLAPFGLERAIRSHAERFEEQHPALTVHLALTPDGQALPETQRLAFYRVYQEAMNNIVKHAEAQNVWITFHLEDGRITLQVRDDGCGFHLPARWIDLGRQEHYGLLGIAERADGIGGQLTVTSAPGAGTTVCVTAPLHPSPSTSHTPPTP